LDFNTILSILTGEAAGQGPKGVLDVSGNYIPARDLKRLSVLQPWRTALAVAGDWALIALSIAASEASGSWWLYLPAVLVIAGRQHALAALLHDFAHYRFMSGKKFSDWVGDLFLAWPLLATLEGYRRNHLGHHRYLNTDQDPDWVVKVGSREFTFPQEMRFAVLNLLGYLVGVSTVRDFRKALARIKADERSTPGYVALRLGFYAAVVAVLTLTGSWTGFLLYWVVPYATFFFMFMYIRSVAEHFGPTMDYGHDLTATRTVIPFPWERLFFAPHHMNYHIEHHLYPSVPHYRLPELSRALMSNPDFAATAHVTRGYVTGLWRELTTRKAEEPQARPAPGMQPAE
jgi:fatty acid desaturase